MSLKQAPGISNMPPLELWTRKKLFISRKWTCAHQTQTSTSPVYVLHPMFQLFITVYALKTDPCQRACVRHSAAPALHCATAFDQNKSDLLSNSLREERERERKSRAHKPQDERFNGWQKAYIVQKDKHGTLKE